MEHQEDRREDEVAPVAALVPLAVRRGAGAATEAAGEVAEVALAAGLGLLAVRLVEEVCREGVGEVEGRSAHSGRGVKSVCV